MILSLSISSYSCFNPFSYIAESSSRLRQYFCETAAGSDYSRLPKVIKKNVSDLRFCKLFLRYFEDDIRLTKPVLHILMRAVIVRRNAGVLFKKPRKIRVI